MQMQHLYQPFEIELIKADVCPMSEHRHSFFEFIYFLDGDGAYYMNGAKFSYNAGNLFLITPMDTHYTRVNNTTTFLFIRFSNIYLRAQQAEAANAHLGDWTRKLEYILQQGNNMQGCLMRNPGDKPLVRAIMDAIVQEHEKQLSMHKELLQQLINTLITIVARNISFSITDKVASGHNLAMDIINYIHLNIYNPTRLRAENLASHFNISVNYISEYFKKHTGGNLQQYIINYKLSLVEARLQYSDMRLNEIAFEFGFTDESHLTKTFKKYRGVNPTAYRKDILQ
ncbi:helix-turn-helix domain-containing protein [Chitinophaga sp. ysch24]|uniref:Helix-turn-helix domain-containing protein n=2 Tax=Chitinophaga tropicalis TaxID=2683588 RepID=A0A7K1UCT5_9BACT|nr:helix-turn-helix domain-containing protein [Chitinophaga tropicalis]